jgi:adenylate cyclase
MEFSQKYPGGTELEITMLFVDVRGSTTLAEHMSPAEFSRHMNRFYRQATDVLIRTDAFIDKLVGDEVMALYFPLFTGPDHAGAAIQAACGLLELSDSENRELPLGVGVHTGVAYVGTVSGAEGTVTDITALGDNVNITARLASAAGPGEALISDAAVAATGRDLSDREPRRLMLKGKSEAVGVRVLRCGAN